MKYFLLLFFNTLIFTCIWSQIPKDYFSTPMKIPLVLSGTFGELRSNHFHSGMDIKTQGKKGINIHTVAQGYVSRIKISEGGYGKAIYIQHPNGYTSVYAHLNKFAPKIEAYVKKKQYAKESYTIELYPKASELPVSKDEIIAYSGNSGGSGGPHLHFEIRDAKSRPMNPMLFGIEIADTKKPLVNTVWLYPLSQDAHINGQHKPYRLKISSHKDGTLTTLPVKACGEIGVGVSTYDQQNAAHNKNGVYKIQTKVNGTPNFELEMKRFSFSETRYINQLLDYNYWTENKSRITKLFIEENNPLSIYNNEHGNGFISVQNALSYTVDLSISDFKGNIKSIFIPITGEVLPATPTNLTDHSSPYLALPEQSFSYKNDYVSFTIPKKAVYDPVALQIIDLPKNKIQIHKDNVPLHKYMNVSFSLQNQLYPHQCYVGTYTDERKPSFVGAKRIKNRITARTRTFGKFGVFTDSISPKIKPINFTNKKWISNNKTLKIKIEDKQTGIKNYKATINGNFALMEYDYKTDLLVYDFNDGVSTIGENNIKLYVEDNVGNNTIFEAVFYRKQ
ncbi:M23 family metallopeptidase [Aquimarina agarivorans]|uniref:M23 family metallopeptidase n=1 Tax=Aquimarina agarivorans TaxID=980584 RepID=UPI000248E7A7|nr:M23 family metallopeptidase [Aquimarina agarivorans]